MPRGRRARVTQRDWPTVNMPNGILTRLTRSTVNMPNGMLRMNDKEA